MTDHLAEARNRVIFAEENMDYDDAKHIAIAHALIDAATSLKDIAESLRWFKQQKEYEINHSHNQGP